MKLASVHELQDEFPELKKLRFRIPFLSKEQSAAITERLKRHAVRGKNGCIVWGGTRIRGGYGRLNIRLYGVHRSYLVHRLAWWLSHGAEIPHYMEIAHKCFDTPECFNPEHIERQRRRYNRADSAHSTLIKRALKAQQERRAA